MQNIKISEIQFGTKKRRKVKDVSALVDSIKTIGLLNPITITKDNVLIAGAHRLAACVKLGWDTIPAIVLDLTPERAELAEIDENLVRNELKYLEQSLQIARRKVLYESIYPGATKRAIATANRTGCESEFSSFSKDTAEKTGQSMRTIQQKNQLATKLAPDIVPVILDMAIADNKKELMALSRRTPDEQRTLVDLIKSNSVKNVSNGISYIRMREKEARPEPYEPVEGEDFIFTASIQCGDYQDVMRSYPAGSVQLVLSDPPYGEGVKNQAWDKDFDPIPLMHEVSRVLANDGSALIFCDDILLGTYLNNRAGLKLRQILHWYKPDHQPSVLEGDTGIRAYTDVIEYILWFTKSDDYTFNAHKIDKSICQSKRTTFFDTGKCSGNERIAKYDGTAFHPCQKPEKLIEALLLVHSNRGDRVCDPFLGTGTTSVLATKWERSFWGCEQDPEHFEVALRRSMFPLGGYPENIESSDNYEEDENVVREFEWNQDMEAQYTADMARYAKSVVS